MVARPLLYLLFAALVGATAYWVVVLSLGGLRDDPFGRSAVPEAWPVPPDAASHPFWGRFPALRGADRDDQRAAWLALATHAFEGSLPHPAAKPADWPLADRVFARALLWRLFRARSFRAHGLELRLGRDADAPAPRAGEASRLQLSVVAIAGHGRARFLADLDALLAAGARLYWFTHPAAALPREFPPAAAADPSPEDQVSAGTRRPLVLRGRRFAALPFQGSGRVTLRVVLDLTRAAIRDRRVPRGLWVSNPLVVDVVPQHAARSAAPDEDR